MSMQAIADEQTLPDMQKLLLQRLSELAGVNAIIADLETLKRGLQTEAAKSRKLQLWLQVRDRSLWAVTAAVWLLPALTLLVHVQVVVLGRHMYLERITAAPDRFPVGAAVHVALGRLGAQMADSRHEGPRLWPLLPTQQEAYMSYSSFLLHDSLMQLMPEMMVLVQQHASSCDLASTLTVEEVWPTSPQHLVLSHWA
jgi:hypothetical protein